LELERAYQDVLKAKTMQVRQEIIETCNNLEKRGFGRPLSQKLDNYHTSQIVNINT
jgi:hypothetical protein